MIVAEHAASRLHPWHEDSLRLDAVARSVGLDDRQHGRGEAENGQQTGSGAKDGDAMRAASVVDEIAAAARWHDPAADMRLQLADSLNSWRCGSATWEPDAEASKGEAGHGC